MKIFLDTNVILEYFMEREEFGVVRQLFQIVHEQGHELYMSVGGFYTMIFVVDKILKQEKGLSGALRLQTLRGIMEAILQTVKVAEHDNASLLRGIADAQFKDVEDSCQYELARKTGCNALITFNTQDYPLTDAAAVGVFSPQQFRDVLASNYRMKDR